MVELIRTPQQIENTVITIRAKCMEYLKLNGMQSMVVGMSGGLDSTVVAALMRPVADELGIPLIGMVLPIESDEEHTEMGLEASRLYCTNTQFWDEHIWDGEPTQLTIYQDLVEVLGPSNELTRGNVKARIRMIILYHEAATTGGLVLSTDNLSEYLLGFWTLNGDVGDLSPIQHIFKGLELPLIAEYLEIPQNYIDQQPTDGLGITNTDVEQFGVESYEEVDRRLIDFIENGIKHEMLCGVVGQHEGTHYKRRGAYVIDRKYFGLDVPAKLRKII